MSIGKSTNGGAAVTVAALVLVILAALPGCQKRSEPASRQVDANAASSRQVDANTASSTPGLETVRLSVHGMQCEDCATAVHMALAKCVGVMADTVRLADSSAVVRFDPSRIQEQDVVQAIDRLGYRAGPWQAPGSR